MLRPDYSPHHQSHTKRNFDLAIGGMILASSWPAELLGLGYLKSIMPGQAGYFRQLREGINVVKLRTMTDGAEAQRVYTRSNDRIPTATARFIRDIRIDELPQARSVIRGDMSVVGFRPLPQAGKEQYRDHLSAKEFGLWEWSRSGPVKPGLSGPAQLATFDMETMDSDFCQAAAEADIRNAREASLSGDVSIVLQTANLITGEVIDHTKQALT